MEISRDVFETQQQRRFGITNPERMPLAFWEWMVRSSEEARLRDWSARQDPNEVGRTPYQLRVFFGQEGDYSRGPVWNFDRMGATRTPHPDGRMICIGGEHEDSYDPDFCIYNDVVVLDLDGSIAIYGYPEDEFPPTDFHTATRQGDRVIVIGRLGYPGRRRHGTTPVLEIDLDTYRCRELPSRGESPGWIFEHEAEANPEGIVVRAGKVAEVIDGVENVRRNCDDFLYDPATGAWRRLTDRRWREFSLRDAESKPLMRGRPPRGGCLGEDDAWMGNALAEFDDTFVWILPEAARPRRFDYESTFTEEFTLEDRITVDGIDVRIAIGPFAVEVVVEGPMEPTRAEALVADIREGIEEDTGRSFITTDRQEL